MTSEDQELIRKALDDAAQDAIAFIDERHLDAELVTVVVGLTIFAGDEARVITSSEVA